MIGNDDTDIQDRELLLELVSLQQELGRLPEAADIHKESEHSLEEFEQAFGSLRDAYRQSGLVAAEDETKEDTVKDEPDDDAIDSSAESAPSLDASTNTETTGIETEKQLISTETYAELSGFQRDLLVVIAGLDSPKGLTIKEELEKYYEEEIHHGRLYPNLDTLVEEGLVDKLSIDKRSNGYVLTLLGKRHLRTRWTWENQLSDSKSTTRVQETGSDSPMETNTSNKDRGEGAASTKLTNTDEGISETQGVLDKIEKEFEKLDEGSE